MHQIIFDFNKQESQIKTELCSLEKQKLISTASAHSGATHQSGPYGGPSPY